MQRLIKIMLFQVALTAPLFASDLSTSCQSMLSLSIPETQLASATVVAETATFPAHCRVVGVTHGETVHRGVGERRDVLGGDDLFKSDVLDAYSQAWAFSFFLYSAQRFFCAAAIRLLAAALSVLFLVAAGAGADLAAVLPCFAEAPPPTLSRT